MALSGTEIFVKNPHSILAALQHRSKDVAEISLPRDMNDETWKKIEQLAQKNKIQLRGSVSEAPRPSPKPIVKPMGKIMGGKSAGKNMIKPAPKEFVGRDSSHGAMIRPKASTSIEQLFADIDQDTRGIWLAIDSLQDPQNLGAIFRSASFFGVRGIVMTAERSAPMSATVYDISSGGVETVPYVQVINLQRAFEVAKKSGLWILGTSEHAKDSIHKIKNDRPWLVVMGSEENGIRRLTEEACDMMCTIPGVGEEHVTSLNVSVATGILLSQLGQK